MEIGVLNIMANSGEWSFAENIVCKHLVYPISDLLEEYGFEFYTDIRGTGLDGGWNSWDFRHEFFTLAVAIRWPQWMPWIDLALLPIEPQDSDYFYWVRDDCEDQFLIFDTHQIYPCPSDWLRRQLEIRGITRPVL